MHILKLDLGGGWSILNYFSVCIEFMKLSVTDICNINTYIKLRIFQIFHKFIENHLSELLILSWSFCSFNQGIVLTSEDFKREE